MVKTEREGKEGTEEKGEKGEAAYDKLLIPPDPLPLTMPPLIRQLSQPTLHHHGRAIQERRKAVIGVGEFRAGVAEVGNGGEEAFDVEAGEEGAGAEPVEAGVEGGVCDDGGGKDQF